MLYEQIQEAVRYIHSQSETKPQFGIILGTGLGNLTDDIEVECEIPYGDIPHFPVSTVQSHKGKLVLGTLEGKKVVAMAGRFHYYEGYSMKQITFPVRVMKFLGVEALIISNAAGSTNHHIYAGDLVFLRDHINMQPEHPLRGPNDERLGPRFPDMLYAYNADWNNKAMGIALENGIRAHVGVYLALQGPNLETPAEYHFVHTVGADLVGMSTVPEVLVAKHMEVPVFVISVVSNKCYPLETLRETTLDEVIEVAKNAEPKMRLIVKEMMQYMAK